MSIRIMHLSDLHFSPSVETTSYDLDQIKAIQKKYEQLDSERPFDRVIVTGDLTADAHIDSFLRAKDWLTNTSNYPKGIRTGLSIDDDIKLKVIPGNKDFNKENRTTNSFPEVYYDGLKDYNKVFLGNHTFFENHPIVYDWFDEGDHGGVLIVYLNTSFYGNDNSNQKFKSNFTDYTCDEIKKLVNQGLKGLLKPYANTEERISSDKFRNSFKIFVSHHSLQKTDDDKLDYLNKRTRNRLLSNLGILDFQVQLSGHNHVYGQPEKRYYNIFDKRAKNRFIFNELKLLICGPNGIDILKSSDGRFFSRSLSLIVQLAYTIITERGDIVNEITQMLHKKKPAESADYLRQLILKGKINNDFSEEDKAKAKSFFREMDELTRLDCEEKAKLILDDLMNKLKSKTLRNFNAGSAAIPHKLNPEQQRHFNVYEIDKTDLSTVLTSYHYVYDPLKQVFTLDSQPTFFDYDKDKIPYEDPSRKLTLKKK